MVVWGWCTLVLKMVEGRIDGRLPFASKGPHRGPLAAARLSCLASRTQHPSTWPGLPKIPAQMPIVPIVPIDGVVVTAPPWPQSPAAPPSVDVVVFNPRGNYVNMVLDATHTTEYNNLARWAGPIRSGLHATSKRGPQNADSPVASMNR